MNDQYDAIIIGAGQAGPTLASRLVAAGRRVAIVERKDLGGTCVNNGCIPTKTLVASARAAHVVRRAAAYGVSIDGQIAVDMQQVKARKDSVVRQSRDGLTTWLQSMDKLRVVRGHARFEDAKTVIVNDERVCADQIFLNVGGRAAVAAMPGVDDVEFLTNSSMMDVDFLPEHLIIVGGSYIGLEFAQMYRRFGSRVTVVERSDRLVKREDADVSFAIQKILESEGVQFRLEANCIALKRHGEKVAVDVICEQGPPEVVGSHILLATGRKPNTADLGLESAGVDTDNRGYITVDDQCRTSVPGVWAIGECNGRGAFTHTAYNDHEIVAGNLLDGEQRRVSDRIPCYGLFVDPPLGRVGLTLAEARAEGRELLVGEMPMSRVGRARERGETDGFMRVLVDAGSQRFVGASILGIGGDEVVHGILDLMYADAPYTVLQRAVHIHPTVSELLPTLLGNLKPAP
ncbi:MAG: FAD-containing oxidoreductase [Pseudomonadota bacterium]